jgi:hypothetical protein
MKYVNEREFRKFCYKWYKKWLGDDKCIHAEVMKNDIGVRITNTKTGKSYVSKCHEDDTFDYMIGVGIAYARYKGAEIPKVVERLSLENSEKLMKIMDRYDIKNMDELDKALGEALTYKEPNFDF